MRNATSLMLLAISLLGCQISNDSDHPVDNNTTDTTNDDAKPATLSLPLYDYSVTKSVDAQAALGDILMLNADDYSYDPTLGYTWVAWTGENLSWNSYAFGEQDLTQPQLQFNLPFPGKYRISWCPTDSTKECVLYGNLTVSGELPANTKPEVTLFYSDDTQHAEVCTAYCSSLLPINEVMRTIPEIKDDDDAHFFSWRGKHFASDEVVVSNNQLGIDGLTYTPEKEGEYTFRVQTYDGHITADGRQSTQNTFDFFAREKNNEWPVTNFFLRGQPAVNAGMHFELDDENNRYYPILQYYYEESISLTNCEAPTRCDEDIWHYNRYQNNLSPEHSIPTFRVGERIEFDGSNSHDPENKALSYLWHAFIEPADNSQSSSRPIKGENQPTYAFTADIAGDYYVSLCVSETDFSRLFSVYSFLATPLDRFHRSLHCPQIQIRVTE